MRAFRNHDLIVAPLSILHQSPLLAPGDSVLLLQCTIFKTSPFSRQLCLAPLPGLAQRMVRCVGYAGEPSSTIAMGPPLSCCLRSRHMSNHTDGQVLCSSAYTCEQQDKRKGATPPGL
ncbi:hypothetical protein DAEQUDRAFT_465549 [Daedalea quercina L-15889]|uniref:Uncharacterized protein n=1 Tax=Daedalea quercina L-15889 TaxID=1314783 RepID=A0A165TFA1_9APHY|nr:hypothetical protein DAEQUDRAFT_465549 [Daedalea quercina L-15889]